MAVEIIILQVKMVVQVGLEVVELLVGLVELEILHQHLLHKEIMVEIPVIQEELPELEQEEEVQVPLVLLLPSWVLVCLVQVEMD